MTRFELDEATLLELLAAVPEVVSLVAPDRTMRFANRDLVGRSPEAVVGRDVMDPVPFEDLLTHSEALDRVFATAERGEIVGHPLRTADGRLEWFDTIGIPLVLDGRTEYVVIVSRDVTERVLAERERAVLAHILAMCAWCGRVRGEDGVWDTLEAYVERTTDETLTRGLCPSCEAATREVG